MKKRMVNFGNDTNIGAFNVHLCKALTGAIGLIPLEWVFFALSKAFYGAELNEAFALHSINKRNTPPCLPWHE